ncbi:lysophospholipase D GDPD3 [Paramisgurnus dabryanus]|uniref:lysophospholipase D GDPD3 n=1 Tax=Paramisgurnus dabryanus TaxID=90735 RepID=UPI0031F467B9
MEAVSGIILFLMAVGVYIVCSVYLLRNPLILHKKKRLEFYCRHISHRGGNGEKIESTIEGFTNAVNMGTEMLEMDCHLTLDGYVVVSHDENILRQTGYDKTLSSLRFKDLPLYKEKLEVTFYVGHYSSGKDRRFALLEDVFKKFPNMPMILEIKEDNGLLIKKVSSLVKQYGRDGITIWASEESKIMDNCQKENPHMPYMFTIWRGAVLLLLFYTGLLPFVPLGESLLLFYLPRIINRTYIPEEAILKKRFVVYLLQKLTMRKSLLEHLVKRGIQVQLLVCNEESDMAAAFSMGATGVMTDYPTLLSNYLEKHPPPLPPTVY